MYIVIVYFYIKLIFKRFINNENLINPTCTEFHQLFYFDKCASASRDEFIFLFDMLTAPFEPTAILSDLLSVYRLETHRLALTLIIQSRF